MHCERPVDDDDAPTGQNYTFAYDAAKELLLNDADPAAAVKRCEPNLPPTAVRRGSMSARRRRGRTTTSDRAHANGDRVENATATDGRKRGWLSAECG